jgi:hypothetical protein
MATKWLVYIIESERGWGQRVDETRKFDAYDKAAAFTNQYNSENNLDAVPDWYMYATDPVAIQE